MIRRFGENIVSGKRYKVRAGVYAILPLAGDLLVTYQAKPAPEFQLPGGGVDPGESPLHALHREVIEETGWKIATPRKLGVFRKFTYMPEYDLWAEKICHIYLARPVRALGYPSEQDHTAVWMNGQHASNLLANEGDCHFVRQWFG
ncbi:NUDIX hydrolase [Marinosulfonomonas sp. PRT-SC04]|nr:NUDIX hydrolase [Marinosulfonomonas sp. PRT-SC04]